MPKAYELPAPGEPFDPQLFKLGKPCKRNHIHADGLTLRYVARRKCPLCERIDGKAREAHRRLTDPEWVRDKRAYALNNQRRLRQQLAYRLYQRSYSKSRKVIQRGGNPSPLSLDQLWQHWCRFDHCCAYCGHAGDLQIEHVIPISKGGQHHLGNIVPACQECNSSKRASDALTWFKRQPFFHQNRWDKILEVTRAHRPLHHQLNLLDA